MPRLIEVDGTVHEFPDDVTDGQIAVALNERTGRGPSGKPLFAGDPEIGPPQDHGPKAPGILEAVNNAVATRPVPQTQGPPIPPGPEPDRYVSPGMGPSQPYNAPRGESLAAPLRRAVDALPPGITQGPIGMGVAGAGKAVAELSEDKMLAASSVIGAKLGVPPGAVSGFLRGAGGLAQGATSPEATLTAVGAAAVPAIGVPALAGMGIHGLAARSIPKVAEGIAAKDPQLVGEGIADVLGDAGLAAMAVPVAKSIVGRVGEAGLGARTARLEAEAAPTRLRQDLGLPPTATDAEVATARGAALRAVHPDTAPDLPPDVAQQAIERIQARPPAPPEHPLVAQIADAVTRRLGLTGFQPEASVLPVKNPVMPTIEGARAVRDQGLIPANRRLGPEPEYRPGVVSAEPQGPPQGNAADLVAAIRAGEDFTPREVMQRFGVDRNTAANILREAELEAAVPEGPSTYHEAATPPPPPPEPPAPTGRQSLREWQIARRLVAGEEVTIPAIREEYGLGRRVAEETLARAQELAQAGAKMQERGKPEPPPEPIGPRSYVSPRERELTSPEAETRRMAYALRESDPAAIETASAEMATRVPKNAVLVPIPSSGGDASANMALARAISEKSGATVVDALERSGPVPSSRERRIAGGPGLTISEHGFRAKSDLLPKDRPVLLVDNVTASGTTMAAAREALGAGEPLTFAKARDFRGPGRMAPAGPVWAYRTRAVGEQGVPFNPDLHENKARATLSLDEATDYANWRRDFTGKPQEIGRFDLTKVEGAKIIDGPQGHPWVVLPRAIPPADFELVKSAYDLGHLEAKDVEAAHLAPEATGATVTGADGTVHEIDLSGLEEPVAPSEATPVPQGSEPVAGGREAQGADLGEVPRASGELGRGEQPGLPQQPPEPVPAGRLKTPDHERLRATLPADVRTGRIPDALLDRVDAIKSVEEAKAVLEKIALRREELRIAVANKVKGAKADARDLEALANLIGMKRASISPYATTSRAVVFGTVLEKLRAINSDEAKYLAEKEAAKAEAKAPEPAAPAAAPAPAPKGAEEPAAMTATEIARAYAAREHRPGEGSWDGSVVEATGKRYGELAERLRRGGWQRLDALTTTNRKGDKNTRDVKNGLDFLREIGAADIAWNREGDPFYGAAGTPLPAELSRTPEETFGWPKDSEAPSVPGGVDADSAGGGGRRGAPTKQPFIEAYLNRPAFEPLPDKVNKSARRRIPLDELEASDLSRDLRDLYDWAHRTLSAATVSDQATLAADNLREKGGERAMNYTKVDHRFQSAHVYFDKTVFPTAKEILDAAGSDEKVDALIRKYPSLAFEDRYVNGEDQPAPELEKYGDDLRALAAATRDAIREVNPNALQEFIPNYLTQSYKNTTRAEDYAATFLKQRSLIGDTSWRKQRIYQGPREYLKAGLIPKFPNPIDRALHHAEQVGKFVAGQKAIAEGRKSGYIRPFYADDAGTLPPTPAGWERLDPRIGTLKSPNRVQIEETFDRELRQGLEDLADSLGIRHDRLFGVGGPIGFSVTNQAHVVTKFGSGTSTLTHEIGHAIDDRFGMWDRIVDSAPDDIRPKVKAQLRRLADLREEGNEGGYSESRGKYLRKKPEQMANLVDAWVNHRARLAAEMPDLYRHALGVIQGIPELKPLLEIHPTLTRDVDTTDVKIRGQITHGYLAAPKPVARILNRYLSPGMSSNPAYRSLHFLFNGLNQAQLGLSPFHLLFTSADAAVSQTAVALSSALRLDPAATIKNLAKIPVAPVANVLQGRKLINAILSEAAVPDDVAEDIRHVVMAGGRFKQDSFYATGARRKFVTALRQAGAELGAGRYGRAASSTYSAAWRAPFAALETAAAPIMEYIVPRQKIGVFLSLANEELARREAHLGRPLLREERRRVLARAWDAVDDRLGQFVYDNTFWNRTAKEALFLAVRSLGWTAGSLRAGLGAVADTATITKRLGRVEGAPPEPETAGEAADEEPTPDLRDMPVTLRMLYVPALFLLTGATMSIYQKLQTGKWPETGKDWFFPRTGGKTPSGAEERVSPPTYVKDYFEWVMHPFQTALSKINPGPRAISELWQNKTFPNARIYDPNGTALQKGKDALAYLGKSMTPIGIQQLERASKNPESKIPAWAQYAGFRPAPAVISDSELVTALKKYAGEHGNMTPLSPEQAARAEKKRDYRSELQTAKTEAEKADIRRRMAADTASWALKKGDVKAIEKGAGQSALQRLFGRSMPIEDAIRFYKMGTPEEQAELKPLLQRKAFGGLSSTGALAIPLWKKDRAPDKREAIEADLREIFPERYANE